MDCNSRDYYVYGWFNLDWKAYFYIGRGRGDRYKTVTGRSKAFKAIISHWNCEPCILVDGLTLEEAEFLEKNRKHYLLFTAGHPILDGEPSDLKAMAQAEGIAAMPVDENGRKISKKTGRGFGREALDVDLALLDGESVSDACKRLGISRTTYYRKVNEVRV